MCGLLHRNCGELRIPAVKLMITALVDSLDKANGQAASIISDSLQNMPGGCF